MATIVDALLVTLGLDPAGMKKGAAEADKVQKKLEDDSKKSNKRMNDDEKKLADERQKRAKEQEAQAKEIATAIAKVRNETLGMLGLFAGGVGIKNFIAQTVDQAAGLKFLSENLDMSVESIQAYERASERMGGSAAGMVAQLQESQREIARLKTGQGPSETMQATFRAAGMAGVSLNEADMKNGNAYLMARSKILAVLYKQNAGNAQLMATQMGISQEQFNLIKMGPEALQKLAAAQLKNSVISKSDAEQALQLKNRWQDFTDSAQATGTKILVSLIPAFKEILGWLQKVTNWIAAHRDDIAKWINEAVPKILSAAEAFGTFVKNMDWKGIIEDAKILLDVITGIVDAVKSIGTFAGETTAKGVLGAEEIGAMSTNVMHKMSAFFGVGAPSVAPQSSTTNSSKSTYNVNVYAPAADGRSIGAATVGALRQHDIANRANFGMRP